MKTIRQSYAARNAEIHRLFTEDEMRQKSIALIYGLSESRVKDIIAAQRRMKNGTK